MVNAAQTTEDGVMVEPDNSDIEERQQVADVERPLLPETVSEAPRPLAGCSWRTRSVIAMARTASLKASTRPAVSPSTGDRSSIQRRESGSRRVVVTGARRSELPPGGIAVISEIQD